MTKQVPPWCSPSVSCSIMPWAVWTECVICSEVSWLCHELCVRPVYSELIKVTQFRVKRRWCNRVHNYLRGQKVWGPLQYFDPCTMLWPQGLQLSEWTEGLRIPAMLLQWPQGLQLSEGTEGLRTPVMLWQWAQGSQLSEEAEGLRTLAFLWQLP